MNENIISSTPHTDRYKYRRTFRELTEKTLLSYKHIELNLLNCWYLLLDACLSKLLICIWKIEITEPHFENQCMFKECDVRACVCANMVLHANIERLQFGWIEWRKRSTFAVCTSRSLLFDIKSLPWNFTQSPTKSHAIHIANATYCFDTHSHTHTFYGTIQFKSCWLWWIVCLFVHFVLSILN